MKNKKIKDQPLVSIIMNCYNGEKYLRDSIESVLKQTYKNWELIFWDNQSNDNSAKIFKSYQDERFCYFYSLKHTTLYKARNLAIEKTNGEFLAFLDTDDLWDEEKLNIQIPYFENQEVGLVYSNLWVIKKNINNKKIYTKKKLPSGKIYDKLLESYNIGILTSVIRKIFFLDLDKKFDDNFMIIGDYDLFLRLSKISSFIGLQEPLAYYRLHGGNLSILNSDLEVHEYELWLNFNKSHLSHLQIQKIKTNINNRRFVNFKFAGKYRECLNILLDLKTNVLSIKNLILFFTPIVLLKELLWYHQNYNDSE